MIGTIDSSSRCPACAARFLYDENRSGPFCPNPPDIRCHGPYRVKFGRQINRRFAYDFKSAETFPVLMRYLQGRARYAQKPAPVRKIQGKARGKVIQLPEATGNKANGMGL